MHGTNTYLVPLLAAARAMRYHRTFCRRYSKRRMNSDFLARVRFFETTPIFRNYVFYTRPRTLY